MVCGSENGTLYFFGGENNYSPMATWNRKVLHEFSARILAVDFNVSLLIYFLSVI